MTLLIPSAPTSSFYFIRRVDIKWQILDRFERQTTAAGLVTRHSCFFYQADAQAALGEQVSQNCASRSRSSDDHVVNHKDLPIVGLYLYCRRRCHLVLLILIWQIWESRDRIYINNGISTSRYRRPGKLRRRDLDEKNCNRVIKRRCG